MFSEKCVQDFRAVHFFFVGQPVGISLALEVVFETSLNNPESEKYMKLATDIETAVSTYQLSNHNGLCAQKKKSPRSTFGSGWLLLSGSDRPS